MTVRQQVLRLLREYPDSSYEEIGSLARCSRQRVHQIAQSAGLTKGRRPPHYRRDLTIDRVLELYNHDILIKEISQILGCCVITVRRRLREAGISSSECLSRSRKIVWRGKLSSRYGK